MFGSSDNNSRALLRHALHRLLIAWAVIPAFLIWTHGQEISSQSETNKSGTISGRVVNESGPMVGATVFVRPVGVAGVGRNTTTNVEGNFQISGLDSVLYYVSATSPAYISAPVDPDLATPTYRVGDSVRLELMRGGVITGTVTNAAGEPMVGVRVRALMVRDHSGRPLRGRAPAFGERATDDRGIYRIYGMASGTFLVQAGGGGAQGSVNVTDFDAPTYAPSSTRDSAAEIQVRSGEETTVDIRYRADTGHSISGTVRTQGQNGANLTLAYVGEATIPSNSGYQSPGARGFTIYGVGDGEYQLVAQEILGTLTPNMMNPDFAFSEPVKVSVKGADVGGLELTPKPLANISGRIALEPSKLQECQNKRQPLFSETLVSLIQNRKESQNDPLAIMRLFTGTPTADKDGGFSMKNVRPGSYSLSPHFYARYWYLKSITIGSSPTAAKQASATKDAARNWVPVKPGDRITGLTITLSEGAASLRGQVTAPEDGKLELEPGLVAYLVPADRDKLDDPLRYFVVEIGSDGAFSFNNLPPGRYSIVAQQPQPNVPTLFEKLRLPDAIEARTRIRRAAETSKTELELKPCQNVTEYKLVLKTQ